MSVAPFKTFAGVNIVTMGQLKTKVRYRSSPINGFISENWYKYQCHKCFLPQLRKIPGLLNQTLVWWCSFFGSDRASIRARWPWPGDFSSKFKFWLGKANMFYWWPFQYAGEHSQPLGRFIECFLCWTTFLWSLLLILHTLLLLNIDISLQLTFPIATWGPHSLYQTNWDFFCCRDFTTPRISCSSKSKTFLQDVEN